MSKQEANYHEFNEVPANWSRGVWKGEKVVNEADPYKWSGDGLPPAIGAKIHCYMNGLGDGVVLGYFAEYGWLGVKVQLKKNPAWRKSQCEGKNPPAHLFGIDLQPRKMRAEAK